MGSHMRKRRLPSSERFVILSGPEARLAVSSVRMAAWKPSDVRKMIALGTGCTCLTLIVLTVLYAFLRGTLSIELLGTVSKAGLAGTGLLGLCLVVVFVIRKAL